MPWNDDSWKDGYDARKLRGPDWDDDEDECYHEGFNINWEGRAECPQCGLEWWAYPNEIRAQRERRRDYDRENRRQWWCDFWASVKSLYRWRREPSQPISDDDLPF